MSEETLRKLCLQVRNWGKWGPDDEIGEHARLPRDVLEGLAMGLL